MWRSSIVRTTIAAASASGSLVPKTQLALARVVSRPLPTVINVKFQSTFAQKDPTPSVSVFDPLDTLERRHSGTGSQEVAEMLKFLGLSSLEELIDKTVPKNIRAKHDLNIKSILGEAQLLKQMKVLASQNKVLRSYIGMGYYNTYTPTVLLRNVMENPGWYTQYTPYQPEVSQGRLESLLNFQTMVCDMTKLQIANASLLDEGTAAAEAMIISFNHSKQKKMNFFVDKDCHPQTIACIKARALPFHVNIIVDDVDTFDFHNNEDICGVMVQYPSSSGLVRDYSSIADKIHEMKGLFCVATDLLALGILKAPGEFGADIALGSSQRFGVPLGYGGPHAAFFAAKEELLRRIPGRIIGVSKDAHDRLAMRLTLQTREQHIRREKASSNICTAQALLANMAAMFAVYHGPQGIRDIAQRVYTLTNILRAGVRSAGHSVHDGEVFDTLTIKTKGSADAVVADALAKGINLRHVDAHTVGISLDETVTEQDLKDLFDVFGVLQTPAEVAIQLGATSIHSLTPSASFKRTSSYLEHEVFNKYHTEHELLRYLYRLQTKDLSLTTSMIPLGSCTMKLNATTEMIPMGWPEFANIHPFVPVDQAKGYHALFKELEADFCEITGFDALSVQPNSGSNGEFTGLRTIQEYHKSIGQGHRDICLIPVSAHGTNPASAAICGLEVVPIKSDEKGNINLQDLKAKVEQYKDRLSCIMITYPSTYGVFEPGVRDVCDIIHKYGGQVYLDGANMNAQVGISRPGDYGADVCHLNLHKTFCIPHGGGGPGMGPIGVKSHLAPFLPSHPIIPTGGAKAILPVAAAPFSSASILTISYIYLKLMGSAGLKRATEIAILKANYMKNKLKGHYKILYTNQNDMCAHEFIIDLREFKTRAGIEAIDVAKRLQDYSFHPPTMSFPVSGTLMIEPTESETKAELDKFIDAMISIRGEIAEIEQGIQPREGNILKNAPHSARVLTSDEWKAPYSREKAVFPLSYLHIHKFWPSVSRVNDVYGDKNLMCSCPPMEDYIK